MQPRATLTLALLAGFPATVAAQEVMQLHYSWVEVIAGSTTPAAGPLAGNSEADPGEGARLRLGVTALISGTSAVGQTTTLTNPAPGGVGTVKGLARAYYDLIGDGNAPTALGNWTSLQGGTSGPFTHSLLAGTVQPGGVVNGLNENVQVFGGAWTPIDYTPRTVTFQPRPATALPLNQHNSILLTYGTAIHFPGPGHPEEYELLVDKFTGTDFGSGLNIPIAPTPAAAAMLAFGALARPRRLST